MPEPTPYDQLKADLERHRNLCMTPGTCPTLRAFAALEEQEGQVAALLGAINEFLADPSHNGGVPMTLAVRYERLIQASHRLGQVGISSLQELASRYTAEQRRAAVEEALSVERIEDAVIVVFRELGAVDDEPMGWPAYVEYGKTAGKVLLVTDVAERLRATLLPEGQPKEEPKP